MEPLPPQVWLVPARYRRFPDPIADIYESEDTSLQDVHQLWGWRWDLTDDLRCANQLGKEARDFLVMEESSQAAIQAAEQELERLKSQKDNTS